MLVTAHYCVPPHYTDFTDMDLTACFFGFANIIIILFYYYCCCIMYLLPCHGEIKLIKNPKQTEDSMRCASARLYTNNKRAHCCFTRLESSFF